MHVVITCWQCMGRAQWCQVKTTSITFYIISFTGSLCFVRARIRSFPFMTLIACSLDPKMSSHVLKRITTPHSAPSTPQPSPPSRRH
jgi:hypothetical protein